MKKIIVASNNKHKIQEIKEILKEYNVVSLKEEGIEIDPEENGTTFIENSYIKAKAILDFIGNKEDILVLADDSGLAVDYLNGAPGVYSARYAGEHGNDEKNNEKLLKELSSVSMENRGAAFKCALVLLGQGVDIRVEGEVRGYILEEEKGDSGFGYDPLFFYPPFNKTFGQTTEEEKNSVSHRGEALKKLRGKLSNI
ncbi:RdgB/HAM1 family non-canonical purine NTP pyrophosphatase [uncultured Clostridium sp.]|uniref:RdgB/HAM1 family non-canonical purine NTP pyrophosphatase n=1 Tax=uncultured Clostridium sp. TaxID=59620 RepID=UPI0025D2CE84|nr:RdgB/HAM1 family non-canonical purine NTP pyrophosphatase [uncultured Clostridium sp.]